MFLKKGEFVYDYYYGKGIVFEDTGNYDIDPTPIMVVFDNEKFAEFTTDGRATPGGKKRLHYTEQDVTPYSYEEVMSATNYELLKVVKHKIDQGRRDIEILDKWCKYKNSTFSWIWTEKPTCETNLDWSNIDMTTIYGSGYSTDWIQITVNKWISRLESSLWNVIDSNGKVNKDELEKVSKDVFIMILGFNDRKYRKIQYVVSKGGR